MTDASTASRHRAWCEIDHGALIANLAALRARAGSGQEIIAVVKANAYGHGAVEVAGTLVGQGISRLAVATLSEAVELRNAGQAGPILLLWGIGPGDGEAVCETGVEPIVDSGTTVDLLESAAAVGGVRIGVHLKVDTGLGRQGIEPSDARDLAERISRSGHLALVGTMTHLAAAEDPAMTDRQIGRLDAVIEALRGAGIDAGAVHVGGTGAILADVGTTADAVRPGIGLYGLSPGTVDARAAGLTPVMSLRSLPLRLFEVAAGTPIGYGMRWTAARRSRLAVLPIGYGDGWPRVHQNNGWALVGGRRMPLVGAISMDGLVVDVTDANPVSLDDEITAEDVAAERGTISYEVTTALRQRLPRRHLRP